MIKLSWIWCLFAGHKNTKHITNSSNYVIGERCGRCDKDLPLGYPKHKLLKSLLGDDYPRDGIHLNDEER